MLKYPELNKMAFTLHLNARHGDLANGCIPIWLETEVQLTAG